MYAGPLDGFVEARKALVKKLRADGDRAEAQRVAKLPKPTVSAWAVNQLAHRRPEILAAYLEAHHRARARQLRAFAQPDEDAKSLAATAVRHERRLLDAAVETARTFLEDVGRGGRNLVDRVRTNLRAAAVSVELQAQVEAGLLAQDLEEPGFDALSRALAESRPEWLEHEIERLARRREAVPEAPAQNPPAAQEEPQPPPPAPAPTVDAEEAAELKALAAAEARQQAHEAQIAVAERAAQKAEERVRRAGEDRAAAERMIEAAQSDVHTREARVAKLKGELVTEEHRLDEARVGAKRAADILDARLRSEALAQEALSAARSRLDSLGSESVDSTSLDPRS